MKLWVDDIRPAPEGWVQAYNSQQAIARLAGLYSDRNDSVDEISLDHDLGGEDTTRVVVNWMCENNVWPKVVRLHTANPVGREWLHGTITRYGPGVTI